LAAAGAPYKEREEDLLQIASTSELGKSLCLTDCLSALAKKVEVRITGALEKLLQPDPAPVTVDKYMEFRAECLRDLMQMDGADQAREHPAVPVARAARAHLQHG
jgi:hypothetical protein